LSVIRQKYHINLRHFQRITLFLLFSLLITTLCPAQVVGVKDTNLAKKKAISKDSLLAKKKDSVQARKPLLDSKVDYHASDSIRLDAAAHKMYLYGNAQVNYQDLMLKAAYIEISIDSSIALAHGVQDSGKTIGKPEFHEGSDIFYAETIRYNFKSKRGRINNIYTKEGEGYIHGEIVKKDSDGVFYMKTGTYSTCALKEDPHFYIAATRLKVIPHSEVITGPADLVIEGVPTPLAIPFGFFPLEAGRHSGILLPTYGESQQLGFFLQNGGYYFGINDNIDMQLRGDIYSFGSWGLKDIVTYDKRYKYSGSFNLSYSDIKLPISGSPEYADQRSFFITWRHTQDPKANPNSTFMANVNAGGSKYYTYTSYDPSQYLSNTFQSSVTFTHNFPQTPFHLTLDGQHSQNTITKQIQVSLPDVAFTTDRIYPAKWFEENPDLYSSKWYNSISFGLTTVATNRINTYDSLFFKPNTLKNMQNGANTTIPISGSFHVFKYVTFTPSVNFNSLAYFQTIRENWKYSELYAKDTLVLDTVQGLKTVNTFNASANLSTNIYSMYSIGSKGAILIRHVLYPTIGFSYHPDYGAGGYGYYQMAQYTSNPEQMIRYSIFQNGIYGGPPAAGKYGAINMGLGNNLEMKVRMHTDSGVTYKKIVIFEHVNIGTSFNMAADSFQWSSLVISGNTTLFKKLSVNFSGNIDPYQTNSEGLDINKLKWADGGGLGRLTSAGLSLSTTLAPSQKQNKPAANSNGTTSNTPYQNTNPMAALQLTAPDQYMYYDAMHPNYYAPISIAPWSLSLFYNLLYTQPSQLAVAQKAVTQSLLLNGSAQLTKFWYMAVTTGFDLVSGQFTATSVSLKRDMHCWEAAFTTIPFGFHQSFSVDIHVKASVLQDLKLSRHRDWEDTQAYGQ
jgi:lipopolysaccharide assembly outer membrane protein LptD (OstA)